MGQLRDRMEADLALAGYSSSTCKIYLVYARLFVRHFKKAPDSMGEREIRLFLLYLIQERMAVKAISKRSLSGMLRHDHEDLSGRIRGSVSCPWVRFRTEESLSAFWEDKTTIGIPSPTAKVKAK